VVDLFVSVDADLFVALQLAPRPIDAFSYVVVEYTHAVCVSFSGRPAVVRRAAFHTEERRVPPNPAADSNRCATCPG
jgi:hypothetical protein